MSVSYDLTGLRLAPGEDPEPAIERLELQADRAPTPDERAAMTQLADALQAVEPAAERHEADAWIELTGDQTQVSVHADEVEISIPYHYDGAEARAALVTALRYAAVLRERGWTVWDPQVEEVVGDVAPRDQQEVYAVGRAAIAGEAPRRPWWRRLRS